MIKNKIVLLVAISFISLSFFSQSLTNKTIEELEIMKKEAISSENYDLANKISEEQKTRISLDDKLKELNTNLKVAVVSENYEEADKINKEIKNVEEKIVAIKKLEEEKKTAILIEDFDKVIALEKQINDLKSNRKPTPVSTTTNNNYTNNNPSTEQTNSSTNSPTNNLSEAIAMSYTNSNQSPNSEIDPASFMSMMAVMQANAVTLVSSEVTPNGDGVNDFLVFKNLEHYPDNILFITTKRGVIVYKTTNYQNNWGGETQNADTYVYSLKIKGRKALKGTFILNKK